MEKRSDSLIKTGLITFCIVLGILFAYVMQQSPAPMLREIKDFYGIVNNDTLLNLCVSIIYGPTVVACLIGAKVEQKLGTRKLFVLTMATMAIGTGSAFFAVNYIMLLVGRALYGLGFGFGIQFIGTAVIAWILNPLNPDYATGTFPMAMCAGIMTAILAIFIYYPQWKKNGMAFTFGSLVVTLATMSYFPRHPVIVIASIIVGAVVINPCIDLSLKPLMKGKGHPLPWVHLGIFVPTFIWCLIVKFAMVPMLGLG